MKALFTAALLLLVAIWPAYGGIPVPYDFKWEETEGMTIEETLKAAPIRCHITNMNFFFENRFVMDACLKRSIDASLAVFKAIADLKHHWEDRQAASEMFIQAWSTVLDLDVIHEQVYGYSYRSKETEEIYNSGMWFYTEGAPQE